MTLTPSSPRATALTNDRLSSVLAEALHHTDLLIESGLVLRLSGLAELDQALELKTAQRSAYHQSLHRLASVLRRISDDEVSHAVLNFTQKLERRLRVGKSPELKVLIELQEQLSTLSNKLQV